MLTPTSFRHLRLPRPEEEIVDIVIADPLIYHLSDQRSAGYLTVMVEERLTGDQYRLQFAPMTHFYWTLDSIELFLEHGTHLGLSTNLFESAPEGHRQREAS